ncbi:MAG: GNAT family N-acetyltransferase [Clostridia bacterium]|nr:GNAT family N-acetyltransferase [Clostridia bacterium]
MITLKEVTEDNWLDACNIQLHDFQKSFVATPLGVIARAYVYRNHRPILRLIYSDLTLVGMFLLKDLEKEPSCYELQQLLIDKRHQNKGYGIAALNQLIDSLREERKYDHIDVSVAKSDLGAIHLYHKVGFVETGYINPAVPNSINLRYVL